MPGSASARGSRLLEREVELARLAELRGQVSRGSGAVALIEGAPGVGKTALLSAACAEAGGREWVVLRGRCGEQERDAPFAAVRECFAAVVADPGDPLLAGAARHAAPALGLAPAEAGAGGMFAAVHGVFWLLANLAAHGAVLVAVDDVQWVDEATARWLEYVLPRVTELSVFVLMTARTGELAADTMISQALAASVELRRITPKPLSEPAVAALLAAAFDEPPEAGLAVACHRATGGNPLLLRALIADLPSAGVLSTEVLERVEPGNVERVVLPRVHRLGEWAVALASAAAVLGEGAELRDAAAVAGLAVADAEGARDELIRHDLLRRSARLSFVHPLIRSAVYGELGLGERARLHRRAAEQLERVEAPAEYVARHLLRVEPAGDRRVFEQLRSGAARALEAGAPEAAIAMLERALREPPPERALCDCLQEVASVGLRIGHPEATRWAREAVAAARSPLELGRATLQLSRALMVQEDHAQADLLSPEALAEIDAVDHDLAVHVEADALVAAAHRPSRRRVSAMRRWMDNPPAGGGAGARAMRSYLALEGCWANIPADKVLQLIGELKDETESLASGLESWPFWYEVDGLALCGRPTRALALIDRAIEEARRRGSVTAFEIASANRAYVNLLLGNVRDAEADALASLEGSARYSWRIGRVFRVRWLIRTLTERGDLATAERLVRQTDAELSAAELSWVDYPYLDSKARLALARGHPREALAQFLALGDALPPDWTSSSDVAWRPGAALAHHALGEIEAALELAEEDLHLADQFGADRVRGIALRTRGLIRAGEAGISDVEHALQLLKAAGAWLEHGWALHTLGVLLRRDRRSVEAREPLRRAIDYAARSGAELLRQRALDELRAAGAKPRRELLSGVEALTARELRVAQLAAHGHSNTEIAQQLFVTYATVDTHLRHVYQKLDVTRKGLAAALAPQTMSLASA